MQEQPTVKEGKKNRGRVNDLPGTIMWSHMNEKHGLTSEQLAHLKQALCEAVVEGKPSTLVRIFDPAVAKEKGVTVEDYESLNEHPELILYEGYYSGHGRASEILTERRTGVGPSLLEKKMKEGAITEVGARKDETTTRKWLGRFGKFLMMGGFIVIIILIVAIVILVSTCR